MQFRVCLPMFPHLGRRCRPPGPDDYRSGELPRELPLYLPPEVWRRLLPWLLLPLLMRLLLLVRALFAVCLLGVSRLAVVVAVAVASAAAVAVAIAIIGARSVAVSARRRLPRNFSWMRSITPHHSCVYRSPCP